MTDQLLIDARLFLDQEAYQYVENADALGSAGAVMGEDLPSLLAAYHVWQTNVNAFDAQREAHVAALVEAGKSILWVEDTWNKTIGTPQMDAEGYSTAKGVAERDLRRALAPFTQE